MQDLFRSLPPILQSIEGAQAVRDALVFSAWRRIAGSGLSAQTVPVSFEEGTLTVAVGSETWQRHLIDLSGQILFKLNAAVGERTVNFIEFVVDNAVVESARVGTVESSDASARAEITPQLASAADAIADDDLREQFLAAAANCLARKRRLAGE